METKSTISMHVTTTWTLYGMVVHRLRLGERDASAICKILVSEARIQRIAYSCPSGTVMFIW